MNNQPFAGAFNDNREDSLVNAAKQSSREKTQAEKRHQQILDLYKRRNGQIKK